MTPGKLVAFRSDRLGARLLCLVNVLRLARDYDLPFAIYWKEALDVGQNLNEATDFFDPDFVARHFLSMSEWRAVRKNSKRIASFTNSGADVLQEALRAGQDVTVDQAFGILTLKGEDESAVRRSCAEIFSQLPYAPELKPTLDAIGQRMSSVVAYHIRRGDLTQSIKAMNKAWPHKYVPDEFYRVHIGNEINQGSSVAIFSDDANTLSSYKTAFPGVLTADDVIGPGPFKPGAQDLLDLFALSRSTRIIAPEQSAFSTTAADLGGLPKVSVAEDLTPALIEKAHHDLQQRLLQDRNSFSGAGEIGQCLAHLSSWHLSAGRKAENINLLAGQVAQGLSISFVFLRLIEEQFVVGDLDGVIETGRRMDEGRVLGSRDYAQAEALRGLAYFHKGDSQNGLRHITNAFWYEPGPGFVSAAVGILLAKGLLNSRNFFAFDPNLTSLFPKRAPQDRVIQAAMQRLHMTDTPFLPNIDSILWDWAPLIRRNPALGPRPSATARSWLKKQGKNTLDERYAIFIRGIFELLASEESVRAEPRAGALTALDMLRRSRLALVGRDRDMAAAFAAKASASDDSPSFPLWEGHLAVGRRDWNMAQERLGTAEKAGFINAHMRFLQAQTHSGLGDPQEALACLRDAIRLAPVESQFRLFEADLLKSIGRHAEALDSLEVLVECDFINPKIPVAYINCLVQLDRIKEARIAIRGAMERYPNNAQVLEMSETIAEDY